MKTYKTGVGVALLAASVLATGMLSAATVPAGATVHVRLQQSISSKDAKSGQSFSAVLDQPLVVEGKTVAPKGANVKGIVSRAVASGRLSTPAELYLKLSSVEVNGRSYPLVTSSVGRKEKSHAKRDTVAAGGGAGLGAIIGGIAGGGKGAAIGAGAGAAAGTVGAAATGKKDITYGVETPMTFSLKQSVSIP